MMNTKYIYFLIIPIVLFFVLTNCNSQPKIYGEKPLDLEKFDFKLNLNEFYPEKYQYRYNKTHYKDYYEIPIHNNLGLEKNIKLIKVDTIYQQGNINLKSIKAPKFIYHKSANFHNYDTITYFNESYFGDLSILSTPEKDIVGVTMAFYDVEQQEVKDFISSLDKKYHKNIKSKGRYMHQDYLPEGTHYDIHTWEGNNKIIKYCVILGKRDDIDENKEPTQPIYKGYLFYLKKEYKDQLVGITNGDLYYFQ